MSEGAAAGDPGTVALVYLCMEVAGCPTVCRHCWAQGTGYGMMPLADIEWVLAREGAAGSAGRTESTSITRQPAVNP